MKLFHFLSFILESSFDQIIFADRHVLFTPKERKTRLHRQCRLGWGTQLHFNQIPPIPHEILKSKKPGVFFCSVTWVFAQCERTITLVPAMWKSCCVLWELRSSECKLTFIPALALLAMHSIYIGQLLRPTAAPLMVRMCARLEGVAIICDYPHPAVPQGWKCFKLN